MYNWTSLIVMCFTMHVFFCLAQQQTLVTKKSGLETSWPFCLSAIRITHVKVKSFPGLLCAVNDQTVWLWVGLGTMLYMVPCCKLNIVSVASFPCTPRPAFCRLQFCKQQEARGQSEKESTQSTLWILSPRKVAYTWSSSCNLLGIQI